MHPAVQTTTSVIRKWRIGFILTSLAVCAVLPADEPPVDLARKVALRETATAAEQSNYTYRQTVTIEEFDGRGARTGEYKEVRDVIFSPTRERSEQFIGKPSMTLVRLKLTPEDFRDLRDVQPLLLTSDQAFLYDTEFRGEESIDGVVCWVLNLRPRQILQGQRLFEGLLWIDKSDFSIVRSEGQAVPQILTTRTENLFPHFTTLRQKIAGGFRFPAMTYADDTLYFRTGPQRIRMVMRYGNYQKFGAESSITFEK